MFMWMYNKRIHLQWELWLMMEKLWENPSISWVVRESGRERDDECICLPLPGAAQTALILTQF